GRLEGGQQRADRHRVALLHLDVLEGARDRRWDLGVDLVGLDLDEQVVLLDLLAGLLQPFPDRALGHRLAKLGHLQLKEAHVSWIPPSSSTPRARASSPRYCPRSAGTRPPGRR